ncbi:MAG: DNA adenine methylase [Planctomycetales bacterium]|nr:DNA adenine methylase [Planctomycetales bacterium]
MGRLKSSAPIKWHGGKSYLAPKIIDLIPPHTHYVEPYFGGGAVFFNKPIEFIEGHSEVVNDIYGDLVNFWQVLQSETLFPEFQFRLSLTPFSKPTFENALAADAQQPLDRAVDFFVRFRQSRQGLGRDFATMSRSRTRRGMNEQVSSWLSAIDGLADAHARLQRVVIFCEDAVQLVRREDDKHSFFYCDPPYLSETRVVKKAYSCEMSDEQHENLLDTLGNLQGKFILSGYPHPIYKAAATRFGWNCREIKIDNKASPLKTKPTKTECLWYNYSN